MYSAPSIYDELIEGPEKIETHKIILQVSFSDGCEEYYDSTDPSDMELFNEHCRDAIQKGQTFSAILTANAD